jgi:hypothetical protein
MILAVLEARCGLSFSPPKSISTSPGGYRVSDPASRSRGGRSFGFALSAAQVAGRVRVFG